MHPLATLRIDLANAKDDLRQAKDHYDTMRAICEMQVATTGKTEADRKRELTVAMAQDDRHRAALHELRTAELTIDRIQAEIDAAEDERRADEWSIRARLADALAGRTEDAAFDYASDRRVTTEARTRYLAPHGAANLDDLYPPR